MKLFLILLFIYFCYKIISSLSIYVKKSQDLEEDVIDVDYEEIE